MVVLQDFEGEFAGSDGAGFVFDRANECLSDAEALMGWEDVEVVNVDDRTGDEG